MRTTHIATVVRVHAAHALVADCRSPSGTWFSMPLALVEGLRVGDAVIVTVDRAPCAGGRPRVVEARRAT